MKRFNFNFPRLKLLFREFHLIVDESLASFLENNNLGVAASLAYYGLFALIPLFLLSIYLLGSYILSSQEVFNELESLGSQILPEVHKIILKEVGSLYDHREIWGAMGFLTLLGAIMPLAVALRAAFFRIYRISERPSLLISKLKDAFAVVLLLILLLFLVMTQIFYSHIIRAYLTRIPLLVSIGNLVAPLLIITLCMGGFYLVFTPVRVRLTHLVIGSVITSLIWTSMRPLFSHLVTFNPHFGIAFGSLKAVFIILLWVYCSFSVLLFVGEVMAHIRKKEVLILKRLISGKVAPDENLRIHLKPFIRSFCQDEVILREGESGANLFYILMGAVRIIKNEQVLTVLKDGEYFGEIAMLLSAPRNATAVACAPTQVVEISKESFNTLLREEPEIVLDLLKVMAERLSKVSQLL